MRPPRTQASKDLIENRDVGGEVDSAQHILNQLDAADLGNESPVWALCGMCVQALPVTGVGIALMGARGSEGLIAATDEIAATLEQLQFDLGEGPCTDAASLGRPVLHPDLRQTGMQQWPALAGPALEAGAAAVFAFPLRIGAAPMGALDLYRDTPGNLSTADIAQVWAFADAASQILRRLQERAPGAIHPDLLDPHDGRLQVHQATGIVSVQAAVGVSEALLLLRARAYFEGRGLVALARDVIDRKVTFSSDTADFHDPR